MNTYSLAKLACRVLAVIVLIQSINSMFSAITALTQFGSYKTADWRSLIYTIGFPIIYLFVAIYLWKGADWIAKKMVDAEDNLELKAEENYERIQLLAFTIMGVWLIADGIPNFIQNISGISMIPASFDYNNFRSSFISQLIRSIAKIIIGIVLIFWSETIVELIKRIKTSRKILPDENENDNKNKEEPE